MKRFLMMVVVVSGMALATGCSSMPLVYNETSHQHVGREQRVAERDVYKEKHQQVSEDAGRYKGQVEVARDFTPTPNQPVAVTDVKPNLLERICRRLRGDNVCSDQKFLQKVGTETVTATNDVYEWRRLQVREQERCVTGPARVSCSDTTVPMVPPCGCAPCQK